MLDRKNIPDHYFLDISTQKVISELDIKPGETIYLIIDSTFKSKRGKKLHNLKKFGLGNGKYVWGHCLVFGIIYYKGHRIPIAFKPYRSKDFCQNTHRKFYTQVELGAQIVNDFVPPDGVKVITLFDSFFSGKKMIDKVNHKKFGYVSVLARNRVITSHNDIPCFLHTVDCRRHSSGDVKFETFHVCPFCRSRPWTHRFPRSGVRYENCMSLL